MYIYVLGFLALCYLLLGRAGLMGFWMVMKWPTTALFGLFYFINYQPLGLNPLILFITALIFALFAEKLPEWFWDLMNLIVYLIVVGVVFYILVEAELIS